MQGEQFLIGDAFQVAAMAAAAARTNATTPAVAVPAVVIQQTFQNDIANPSVVPQKPTGSSVQNQGADNSRPSEDKSSKRARS